MLIEYSRGRKKKEIVTNLKFISGVLGGENVSGNIWKSNAKRSDRIYLTQVLFECVTKPQVGAWVSNEGRRLLVKVHTFIKY